DAERRRRRRGRRGGRRNRRGRDGEPGYAGPNGQESGQGNDQGNGQGNGHDGEHAEVAHGGVEPEVAEAVADLGGPAEARAASEPRHEPQPFEPVARDAPYEPRVTEA